MPLQAKEALADWQKRGGKRTFEAAAKFFTSA
jgi:hypothetical protein